MTATDTDNLQADLRERFGAALTIGEGCDLAPDLIIEIDDDATVSLGDRVSIRRGTTIQAHRGGHVMIGDDVAMGENVFISAMIAIRIGDGVGISNMVDLHDHNHRERSHHNLPVPELAPWASGFAGAPIIVEAGAVLSNKASITAGVRIGQNSILGANSVATRTVPPNTIAAGTPAKPIRSFHGPISTNGDRQTLRFAWFGTSIMEHLEGYNAQMFNQANLPDIGSTVPVEGWRNRGYVDRLRLTLQAAWPHLGFLFDNHGEGGATSRDILQIIRDTIDLDTARADVAFFGCGINDVWRQHQGRTAEAVDPDEYAANYRAALDLLTATARRVVCISETPFGWESELDTDLLNADIQRYNAIAATAATDAGAAFIDVWPAFTAAASELGGWSEQTRPTDALWSDGVHLSELGDAVLLALVDQYLSEANVITELTTYQILEREQAQKFYAGLV
jgi:acetyltransferase-like isoleucine patch superfamily enzyme/lysophospholipase L1-like esterase